MRVAVRKLRTDNRDEVPNAVDEGSSTCAILLTKSLKVSTVQRQGIAAAANMFSQR